MSAGVKVGDLFALNIAGRFETYQEWRFCSVHKVTPKGKFRLEGIEGLWTLEVNTNQAMRPGRDMWSGRTCVYRLTDENRKHYDADNASAELRRRYRAATHILGRRQFNADLMTEARVKLLERFINETEVHS